jgi:glycerate-2-kinase
VVHRVTTEGLVWVAQTVLERVSGRVLVARALYGRTGPPVRVWAIGKAAGAMTLGALDALGERVSSALAIVKEPWTPPDERVRVRVGAHPYPDERSARAGRALEDEARSVGAGEPVILLISGGASALACAPVDGVSIDELRAATETLVRSGAPIDEINAVRRRLGRVLGGRLAIACADRELEALLLSDVIGDDPATIGSGPVSPDPTTRAQAIAIARRAGLDGALIERLERLPETPKAGDPAFARVRTRVLADPSTLRDAAARELPPRGLRARVREELVSGELTELADEVAETAETLAPGEVWVAAGEPTISVAGPGRGGRAQHLALRVAKAIAGRPLAFVALGSDGSDGPTPAAGAAVDGGTFELARARGLDPEEALARFDSHPLLERIGATIVTGPTGTNLTDLFLLGRSA